MYVDGTYLHVQRPADHELAKELYYPPYGNHITKYLIVCTVDPKVCIIDYSFIFVRKILKWRKEIIILIKIFRSRCKNTYRKKAKKYVL